MRGSHQVMLQMAKWRSRVGESLVQIDLGYTGRARLGPDLCRKWLEHGLWGQTAWVQVPLLAM